MCLQHFSRTHLWSTSRSWGSQQQQILLTRKNRCGIFARFHDSMFWYFSTSWYTHIQSPLIKSLHFLNVFFNGSNCKPSVEGIIFNVSSFPLKLGNVLQNYGYWRCSIPRRNMQTRRGHFVPKSILNILLMPTLLTFPNVGPPLHIIWGVSIA